MSGQTLCKCEHDKFGKIRVSKYKGQNLYVAKDIAVKLKIPLFFIPKICKSAIKKQIDKSGYKYNLITLEDVNLLIDKCWLKIAQDFKSWINKAEPIQVISKKEKKKIKKEQRALKKASNAATEAQIIKREKIKIKVTLI